MVETLSPMVAVMTVVSPMAEAQCQRLVMWVPLAEAHRRLLVAWLLQQQSVPGGQQQVSRKASPLWWKSGRSQSSSPWSGCVVQ